MKLGVHKNELAASVYAADEVFWFQPENMGWSLAEVAAAGQSPAQVFSDHESLLAAVVQTAQPGDWIIVMSNGGFAAMPKRIAAALQEKH